MKLSNPPSEIVAWLIIELGLGTDPLSEPQGAWPTCSDNEPSAPDNVVTVYDTQGIDDGRTMYDGEVLRHWGFQVRVRSTDKLTGWQKTDAIRDALERQVKDNTVNVPADIGTGVTQYHVHCIARIGQTLSIGTDAPNTKRHLHTLNALLSVQPVTP